MPDEWSDRRDALPQGSVLRDYTIEEVLGHGGFGIVYKARHNELDHVVAIKEYLPSELAVREGATIRARSADCETHFVDGLRRFREEAKALIDFQQHPSIVDCRDFFRANGTAYLVMEYVEGLPLSELLRQREAAGQPFTESDLLGIAIPLGEGLAHIHRAGVIHRDIKPANILVQSTDQQPVLIDFGAAKQAVAEHSRSLAPYTEGYAALEQVADGQLGPWTDLYGFGAVLWRMVAGGNRPWDPPNPVKVESRANAGLRDADDPLPAAKELGAGRFADRLLELIDGCLQLKDTDRTRESERVVQVLQGSGEGGSLPPATAGQRVEGGHDVAQPDPVSKDVRTGPTSKGRLWKIVGVAAAIVAAVVLAAVTLVPRDGTVETLDRWSFSVEAEPSTATVALLNGPEEYRPGMLLVPGRYEVEVSAPGFVTRRELVTHSESETRHQVQLEVIPDVGSELAQTPSEAVTESSDSSAMEQERVSRNVSDAEQSVAEGHPEPVQTPPEENSEVADATTVESDQVRREVSDASKTLVTDSVPASENEKTDTKDVSPSNCGDGPGGWANCFELGESYYWDAVLPSDYARAAEFYNQACHGRIAAGCFRLGIMHSVGIGVGQDEARAVELLRQACEGGDAAGCAYLGLSYFRGEGVGQDRARAAELYQRACEGGDAEGCFNAGLVYFEGEGVPLDRARATEFYQRACEGGLASGCFNAGLVYSVGEGVPLDRGRAAGLYQRACEGRDAEGCNNLGLMYDKGEGVGQDRARAAELYGRACEGEDAEGCYNLGVMYDRGEGVPLDHARAAELYEQACDGGDAEGCHNLGLKHDKGEGVGQDRTRAAELYGSACEGGVATSCNNLGVMYSQGEGAPLDRGRAAELYHRGCEGGHALACHNLGLLYDNGHGVGQDWGRAAELYHRACEGGVTSGCFNLGNAYFHGEGVRQDRARATELYRRACDGDNMSACHNLGISYYHGQGVGQDRSVAASLFRKACANGNQGACEKLETLGWR